MAGIVRAHVAAQKVGLPLLVGSRFEVLAEAPAQADEATPEAWAAGWLEAEDAMDAAVGGAAPAPAPEAPVPTPTPEPPTGPPCAFTLGVIACHLAGYGNLCEFITRLRRASPEKGRYTLTLDDLTQAAATGALAGCVLIAAPQRGASPPRLLGLARWLLTHFSGHCWLGVSLLRQLDDEMWLHRLRQASALSAIPLVAVGDVHMHVRSRKPLQDVLTATRVGLPLAACGHALQPNAERHLRTRLRLAQTFAPELLAETLQVAARCRFSLDELRYQYPAEVVPAGQTPTQHLRRLTWEGAGQRWPQGVPASVEAQIEHELQLIAELRYEHYFLTVHDVVAFARARHILCQGRGSAANSVVCYCLGITEVDPARMSVLFERFISKERNEPPDIDVDFEHERREEVIQYLYAKYGRERAALTAVAITYRPKSAIRDVGKALGIAPEVVDALAKNHSWWDGAGLKTERFEELGLDVNDLALRQLIELTGQLIGFPRHLSQHPGGFVLTQGPLARLVPIENAAMPERTVIQWDKDDIDALGLLKVDVLALGMLTALRKSLDLIALRKGQAFGLQDIPPEDSTTYDMVCQADTVGVFQIESRAQMSMLPRLRPRCFYDLVIEVAIVRPGPIQGGMVHPYLNRRQGKEPVSYPSQALREALGRTLGVPVFQEQVMQVAILAAGFTPGEADQLRRAMAAWKRKGGLQQYHAKIVDGMTRRGYERAFAEAIFEQIKGFSEYGFPESHAASFALLVYASCWIKCHHPAEFLAAMLNSQPLGFYAPSQLVQDAQRHGVDVRPVDVMHSHWDCTLEDLPHPPAVRLGLRQVAGLRAQSGQRIAAERARAPFDSTEDLALRAGLDQREITLLAGADALASLSGHRRQQVWDASGLRRAPQLLQHAPVDETPLDLPPAPEGEDVVWDYATTGLTLRRHPLALLRPTLQRQGWMTAAQLDRLDPGRPARACGIVTVRQQPETAHGVMFISLEDETGPVQVIVWPSLKARQRPTLLHARLLAVKGTWQREGEVRNLIAGHVQDLTPLLGRLATGSRDFR
ncbi:error-prone DNA polymerase [Ideonella sp. TBM-1]|uniref:Error-prone DNA polymerase n=2 Tax=Ideonella livida TaxID=2707176 RepID=A0A7C9PJU2_9BURK|nr:error-prone DNA polymerase [Ideonella livida]